MEIEEKNFQSQEVKTDYTMNLPNHLVKEIKPREFLGS